MSVSTTIHLEVRSSCGFRTWCGISRRVWPGREWLDHVSISDMDRITCVECLNRYRDHHYDHMMEHARELILIDDRAQRLKEDEYVV